MYTKGKNTTRTTKADQTTLPQGAPEPDSSEEKHRNRDWSSEGNERDHNWDPKNNYEPTKGDKKKRLSLLVVILSPDGTFEPLLGWGMPLPQKFLTRLKVRSLFRTFPGSRRHVLNLNAGIFRWISLFCHIAYKGNRTQLFHEPPRMVLPKLNELWEFLCVVCFFSVLISPWLAENQYLTDCVTVLR
jgi:hypothetical protein